MEFKNAIRSSLTIADFMVQRYVADLTPEELLTRPAPYANHVAWQLGHLIVSERRLVEAAAPGAMPPLPDGFAERHTKDTAATDNPADFLSKDEYLKLAEEVRAATLDVLEQFSEADFDQPITAKVPPWIKHAGDCFVTIGSHWVLHAGQWVVLRRKLGRPRMF